MKCKICGCDEFIAHRVCNTDIIVDEDGCFIEGIEGGIYYAADPFGPYTCKRCGAVYDELDPDTMTDGPIEGWEKRSSVFEKVSDEPTSMGNGRSQVWHGAAYDVKLTFDEHGHSFIRIWGNRNRLPYACCPRKSDGTLGHVCIETPCRDLMNPDQCLETIQDLQEAAKYASYISMLFAAPLNDGTFDKEATYLYA